MENPDFQETDAYTHNLEKPLDFKDVKIGHWVMVIFEDKKFLMKVLGKKMVKHKCSTQRSHMALQIYKILNMLYFIQRCLMQKLFQKCFFQQKMALTVLGKLKFCNFTFVDYKLLNKKF